jgi:hypothetical protein
MPRAQKSDTTTPRPPRRKRGGQELPDSVQDRPEQNEGYDAAVHHGEAAVPDEPLGFGDADVSPEEREMSEHVLPDSPHRRTAMEEIDDQAEQDAINEVRRREKR